MNRSNCTNLKQFEGGRVVKQGDSASLFGFAMYDERWTPIDLEGQEATVHFTSKKGKASFSTTVQGSKVSFKIPKVLPVESYLVEVDCGGYVFPSDQSVRVDVIQSAEEYTSEQVLDLVKNNVKEEIDKYISAHPNGSQTEELPDLTVLYNLAKIQRGKIMTLNTEKLTSFAQAVGSDIKEIKTTLASKADKSEVGQGGITQQQLDTAIQGVKTAILGEGVPEELDTLKEIADKIQAGGSSDGAIVSKMTELGQKFTDLENTDFVQIYTTAKNTL